MAGLDLQDLIARIATRGPGRSEATLQADIRTLLLAAPLNLTEHGVEAINLESPAGERRRIDIEAGYTVIEVKRDLRLGNVRAEAIAQLAGYVEQRTSTLGQRYVGVLTDGAEWLIYHLTPSGALEQAGAPLLIAPTDVNLDEVLVWLEGILATGQQVMPTPVEIEQRLGAASPSHVLDFADLFALYEANRHHPSVALKRELWAKLLTTALGTNFRDDDALFVEHTLLVVTAEVLAHAVVGYEPERLTPSTILSGALFAEAQITGVVEEDFFDWLLEIDGGAAFVRGLARRLGRFKWDAVEHDVMKVLYESVIGRLERHSLGEYYTPDWLAERVVKEVVTDPLQQRVLDPACGSGTFLFHAVRHYLAEAEAADVPLSQALRDTGERVIGMDLHPVAVTLARVTYLLAVGMERIASPERGPFNIPVYLGDSLQWGQEQTLLNAGALTIATRDSAQLFASELRFPDSLIADAARFDRLVAELADKAADRPTGAPTPSLRETFRRYPVTEVERTTLEETFRVMCELYDQDRDHIWGYYVRNLARPTWLTQEGNRVDVLLGNPPWLTYNAIAPELKRAFRTACEERNLWGGARTARNYDLSALFVVRAIELYLRSGGSFGFVMPFATLSRRQFTGFRAADYPSASEPVTVTFDAPWDLDAVRPHPFPVPCSVVFGVRNGAADASPLPAETTAWRGTLPARNVGWGEAREHLTQEAGRIAVATGDHASPYARRFESGAKVNPGLLVVVELAPSGPLGVPAGYASVQSLRSPQEKEPWKDLPSLRGTVEAEFVRRLHRGSTLLPFRAAESLRVIVPWDRSVKRLLTSTDERLDRYPKLSEWWNRADELWTDYGTPENYDLTGRIDFQRKLTRQLPPPEHRVLYTASGSRMAAARLSHSDAVIQHDLYWAAMSTVEEAHYLTAVLNSEVLGKLVAQYQARGKYGARHFDLYVWYAPIPAFAPSESVHMQLAQLGQRAETVVAALDLPSSLGFRAARNRVRQALSVDGVEAEIEACVANLLAGGAPATVTRP